ncbi:MAG TPA: hypothetical protein VM367_12335 [Pseudonocardia sp.]|jgi:hypothetical protein|nr:hypothetical protein [Pseudonocardia sp.]
MSSPDPDEVDAEIVEGPWPTRAVAVVPDQPGHWPDLDDPPDDVRDDPDGALAVWLADVADRAALPSLDHLTARVCWWWRTTRRATVWALCHPHTLAWRPVRPILRGTAVTWRCWRTWCTEADLADLVLAAPPGQAGQLAAAKELREARAGHRRLSTLIVLLVVAGAAAAWWTRPVLLVALAVVALAVLGVVGYRHPDPDAPPPARRRTLLEEGAPLGALSASILERLNADGVRAELASPLRVHPGGQYRVLVTHEDAIRPEHLRGLERHLAARAGSIRLVGTDDAGTSELRLPTRDHLAHVPCRAWAPTGSRSVTDPAPLWLRDDGDPSPPVLAAIHVDMVGTTGSAKSSGLQEFISFFGECADVYPVFADLTMGPLGALNRRVLRRTAYDEDALHTLLDWVWARVQERHLELHRLAESDDDDAPTEWDLQWGAQIEVVIDEYSYVAQLPELHAKVERIMRVGRKVKVCVIRASQKAGNADLGSTVAASLVGLKILLACTERDTTSMLSTGHRDQGWAPHLFRPAVPGDPRDAGRCYVWGPSHRDPEVHRFHTPLDPGEVKRRDRRRAADGLPNLDGTPPGERPAILLSPVQTAVEDIFTERAAPWLPTAVLLADLTDRGHSVAAAQLGDELGNCGSREPWDGKAQVRGYRLADVHRAWGVEQ